MTAITGLSRRDISPRDAYSEVCRDILMRRERIGDIIRAQAAKVMNVSLTKVQVVDAAYELINNGVTLFKAEVYQKFPIAPWSDFAEMAINTSKEQYFYPVLLRDVQNILLGQEKKINIVEASGNWDL